MLIARFDGKELVPYWTAQVTGAIAAAIILYAAVASGAGIVPIAIGLGLTLIHLISIRVSNTSVNPARSTGVALFADGHAWAQLWIFWLAPLVGAALGPLIWKAMTTDN